MSCIFENFNQKSRGKNVKDNTFYNDCWEKGSSVPDLEASVLLPFCVSPYKDVSVSLGAFSPHLECTFGKP